MRVYFDGPLGDILEQMADFLACAPKINRDDVSAKAKKTAIPTNGVQGPGPEPKGVQGATGPTAGPDDAGAVDKTGDKPVESPADRMAKVRAARGKKKDEPKVVEEQKAAAEPFGEADKKAPSPAELVAIRQKTIDELQAAYANGKQQEVFELLSRFGDGAKSFRELKPEAFVPIREAIDLGALT